MITVQEVVFNEEEFQKMLDAEVASQETMEFYQFNEETEELFDELVYDFISI